jgi:cyclopropane fatty-acyl-phospholipid synthase-like methyltransferase
MRAPHLPAAVLDETGLGNAPGGDHYRAYVGPPQDYDLVAAMSFGLLVALGLRQHHRVLDIGCGSLRVGRLLMPYLNKGGYTGLEPNRWLVEEGIEREVGRDQIRIKQPTFIFEATADELVDGAARFEYLLAQSIFSHCGPDLLEGWFAQSAQLLADDGALVATYLEDSADNDVKGWIYPDCVAYTRETLATVAARHGLVFKDLDWRHPRQRWALFAKPGFDTDGTGATDLSWNVAFDRINARHQRAP